MITGFNLVNPVRLSPIQSRAFSFCNTQVNHSSLILGGFDRDAGGNRYQSQLLIREFPSQTQVKLGLNHVPTLFHFVFHLFLGKSLIYLVCSHVPPRKIGDRQGKLGKTWWGRGSFSQWKAKPQSLSWKCWNTEHCIKNKHYNNNNKNIYIYITRTYLFFSFSFSMFPVSIRKVYQVEQWEHQ